MGKILPEIILSCMNKLFSLKTDPVWKGFVTQESKQEIKSNSKNSMSYLLLEMYPHERLKGTDYEENIIHTK